MISDEPNFLFDSLDRLIIVVAGHYPSPERQLWPIDGTRWDGWLKLERKPGRLSCISLERCHCRTAFGSAVREKETDGNRFRQHRG